MKERAEKKARRAKRRKKKLALARGGRGSGSGSSDSDADDADVEDGDEGDGDSDASDGDDGSSSGGDDDNMNAAAAEMRAALLRQEREEARDPNDDGRSPSHTAVTLAIGHMPTMRSALKLDVISALAKKAGRTDPNAVAGKRDAKGDFITKLDVTAGEMLRLDHQERMTRAKANALDGILQPDEEPKPARVVVWADFSVRRYKQKARARDGTVTEIDRPLPLKQLKRYCRIVARMFNNVPHDYREAGLPYTRCRCRIVTVGVKDPHRYVRLAFFGGEGDGETEPISWLERGLPIGKIACVVQKFSLQLEIGFLFVDLFKLSSQFKDCASRLYGRRRTSSASRAPAAVRGRVQAAQGGRARDGREGGRDAVERPAHAPRRARHERQGHAQEGAPAAAHCLRRQAESIGYGELSQFGEGVVKAIFERFDADVDDALSFEEVTALQRALGQIPLTDAPEYLRSVAEGGFAVDKQGFITPEGLVAYYDTHGRLAEDAAALGVGAVDDYVTGLLTLTSEIDAAALAHVEALFEKGYHHERALKALTFLARFAKDSYVDAECARLSSLWLRYAAPDQAAPPEWLTKPGWIPERIEALRVWLADGEVGVIPEIRAREASCGCARRADKWGFFDKEEDADDDEKVLPSAEKAAADRRRGRGGGGGGRAEQRGDSTDPGPSPWSTRARARGRGGAPRPRTARAGGRRGGRRRGAAAGGDAGGDAADEAGQKPKLGNRMKPGLVDAHLG